MPTYAIATFFVIMIILLVDIMLKKRIYSQRRFWIFQTIVLLLTTIVDQFSSEVVVFYNEPILLGQRVGNVPIENLFFGFALMYANVLFFELLNTQVTGHK